MNVAYAATLGAAHAETGPPLWLGLPFAGILLSIAFAPLFIREWWHVHYGKAAAFWALLALAGVLVTQGLDTALNDLTHAIVDEYLPFILMLFALYTAAGGIKVSGLLHGTAFSNTIFLALGTALSSVIGTTAASMLLIRPFLEANQARQSKTHLAVFFIFLVSNIGGALSPLGDPPLFMGFLNGVHFFWPLQNLWLETLFMVMSVLGIFLIFDVISSSREATSASKPQPVPLKISGIANLPLIALAVGVLVMSGVWHPGLGVELFGVRLELQNAVREIAMLLIGLLSLLLTAAKAREENGFDWEPLREVAKLFAAIFICIIPVMAMLKAKQDGPFAAFIALLSTPDGTFKNPLIFWATGLLSSALDNAPTYLVFFNLAGGDPAELMGKLARTLAAISLGAVYMGANTYIGNAPNFMVYAIARNSGVKMPSFFTYMLWSGLILLPLFGLLSTMFF